MRRRRKDKYSVSSIHVAEKTNGVLKYSLLIARLLLAAVFIFSGFVKAIDPLGSTYKFQDYLFSFGGIFTYLSSLSFIAAIALSTFELLIGICFLFKIKIKSTSIVALLFMMVMLPLTLYIALKNPVTDCGCFGDALIISNWATFYKNIVITLLIFFLLIFNHVVYKFLSRSGEWLAIALFVALALGLSFYSYTHLPMLDFRPYKVGVDIAKAMEIPEGMPHDRYETILTYEKDGVREDFTIDNYPANDSTWVFIEQQSTLVEKGYEPPIHDFDIIDENGAYITDDIINNTGVVHLLIMYDLDVALEKTIAKTIELYQNAEANNEIFYAITASNDDAIEAFKQKHQVDYPFCTADPITLKTIVRANPGLVTIQNGIIIAKKNIRNIK